MAADGTPGASGQPKDEPQPKGKMPNEGGDPQPKPDASEASSELERVRAALKDANAEAANNRRKLREFEDKQKQAEEGKLSEQQKFKELAEVRAKELEGIKTRMKSSAITSALMTEAIKAGIVDNDALKLVDQSKLIYSEDDNSVLGAAEIVADFKKSKPYLFKTGDSPKNPKPPAPSFSKDGEATIDDIAKLSPKEQVAHFKKIREERAKLSPFSTKRFS